MNKIKLLLLIILVTITCTGCTAEYNITISKDSIEEVIYVNDNVTSNRNKKDILNHYNMWYPTYVNYITDGETIELEDFSEKADGIEYYNKSIEENNNGYNYTYKYKHDIDNYYDTYILARTFLETTVQNGYTNLVLKTSNKNFLCDYDYFDEVKVNITIDPEVYTLNHTNTSNINGNTYTWILDRSNCDDSQILLTLDTNPYSGIGDGNKDNLNIRKESEYTMYIFLGVLVLIIIIGYFIFKKMKEKNEKIDLDD